MNKPIQVEQTPVDSLIPFARNARTHSDEQVKQIAASIREFGFNNPILIREDLTVIAGHGRLAAAKVLGLKEVPTISLAHLTPLQVRAYVLADNKLALNAGWDDEMLALELEELGMEGFDVALTGFDEVEIGALLADKTEEVMIDEDAVPDMPANPVTVRGDIWTLGSHRLLCGDCRNHSDVEKLLAGRKINAAVTSPPYASQRKYDESSGFKPIPPDEYVEWYRDVAANILAHLADDGSYFCNITEAASDGLKLDYVKRLLIKHIDEWGWKWIEEYCWPRPAMPLNPNTSRRFKNGWESVYHYSLSKKYKYRPDEVRHKSDGCFKYSDQKAAGKMIGGNAQGVGGGIMSPVNSGEGMAYPSNVLPNFGGADVVGHSAAYPVGLPEFFIKAFTDTGDMVFDPFMGSGTTMIASEKNGRASCGTEISPQYCDVIVKRWQDFTGKKATLESNGKTFDELKTK